jgi:SAM-dependent methyltransferase
MVPALRRLVRRFMPRLTHPLLDSPPVDERLDHDYQTAYVASTSDSAGDFVRHRFAEGLRWRNVVTAYVPEGRHRTRVLDVGAGNGAVELAFSASPRFSVSSIEFLWNADAVNVHRAAGAPLRRSIADARQLPYKTASIDAVLYLETIEHVTDPAAVGNEISRVLRDDGIVLLTTPPRWRYAFQPDPHFNIRGLVLLPHSFQRAIARWSGYSSAEHYVDRLYSSVPQIARRFPDCEVLAVLSRSRAPKRWFWDAIVLRRRPRA